MAIKFEPHIHQPTTDEVLLSSTTKLQLDPQISKEETVWDSEIWLVTYSCHFESKKK